MIPLRHAHISRLVPPRRKIAVESPDHGAHVASDAQDCAAGVQGQPSADGARQGGRQATGAGAQRQRDQRIADQNLVNRFVRAFGYDQNDNVCV